MLDKKADPTRSDDRVHPQALARAVSDFAADDAVEEAGLPVFSSGATFKNPDFAMFAEACGAHGFRVTRPSALRETVATALAMRGAVIVDVAVDPGEIPAMPRMRLDQIWKFGIGKMREFLHS